MGPIVRDSLICFAVWLGVCLLVCTGVAVFYKKITAALGMKAAAVREATRLKSLLAAQLRVFMKWQRIVKNNNLTMSRRRRAQRIANTLKTRIQTGKP